MNASWIATLKTRGAARVTNTISGDYMRLRTKPRGRRSYEKNVAKGGTLSRRSRIGDGADSLRRERRRDGSKLGLKKEAWGKK